MKRFPWLLTALYLALSAKGLEGAESIKMPSKAERLILPRVEFHEISPAEALRLIDRKAKEVDPARTGVPIVLTGGPELQKAYLTLSVQKIPLSEILKALAQLADLEIKVEGNTIHLKSKGGEATAGGALPSPLEMARPGGKAVKLPAKAERLVLPELKLQNVSPAEAVRLIASKAKEADPQRKGVVINLTGGAELHEAGITLSVRRIPVAEALRALAQLADLEITVEEKTETIYLKSREAIVAPVPGAANPEPAPEINPAPSNDGAAR